MTLEIKMKLIALIAVAAGVGACQSTSPTADMAPAAAPRGLAFVQGSCGGCHAVERHGASPNSDAPPFAAIVNREGLTPGTLKTWLRDAHNYPEEMEFYLEGREVDELVAYMLTLRDPNYRPAI
jgi:mono/diheme cytochrome c family protein